MQVPDNPDGPLPLERGAAVTSCAGDAHEIVPGRPLAVVIRRVDSLSSDLLRRDGAPRRSRCRLGRAASTAPASGASRLNAMRARGVARPRPGALGGRGSATSTALSVSRYIGFRSSGDFVKTRRGMPRSCAKAATSSPRSGTSAAGMFQPSRRSTMLPIADAGRVLLLREERERAHAGHEDRQPECVHERHAQLAACGRPGRRRRP